MISRFRLLLFALGVTLVCVDSGWRPVARAQTRTASHAPIVLSPTAFGVSPAARDLPELAEPEAAEGSDPVKSRPMRTFRIEQPDSVVIADGALQDFAAAAPSLPSPSASFEGMSNQENLTAFGFRVNPPDTNGDVGPNHYVQMVNLLVRVFAKNGTPLTKSFKLTNLWQTVGGECAMTDQGDPLVLYDPLADRWVLSQFGFATPFSRPYFQCIAVSRTSDPTGDYFVYSFELPGGNFQDYPKIGVWPDAYYMTTNQFFEGGFFNGTGAFAFDRLKMLAGDPAAALVYFDLNLTDFPEAIGGMLPSDIDGLRAPEHETANTFVYFLADEFGDQLDALRLFDFHVDFRDPEDSTFTERLESPLAVATFNPRTPPGRDDIEQPPPASNAAALDAISDRLMHRLAYRNLDSHESLVVTHTVNVGRGNTLATYQAGVRYYELRRSNEDSPFAIAEQATFAPDTDSRWMGSAAMDNQGNIAVGYSVSSRRTFPSIRYAGRLATDPPGGLFQGEQTLIAGTGVQRSVGSRWGDYTAMSIDPTDDCTFWYTNEYYTAQSQASSVVGWLTRIGRFAFPSCTPAPKGAMTGVVRDAGTGALIRGASVVLRDGFFRMTDSAGAYSMTLAPDEYKATASAFGYAPAEAEVDVADGQSTALDFMLTPIPVIVAAGVTLSRESCSLNGTVDPNERVTADFSLRNIGFADANPLVATLESSGGVHDREENRRSFGLVQAGGPPVTQKFTFTARVACGGTLTATLRLRTGDRELPRVRFVFTAGAASGTVTTATYSSGNLNAAIEDVATTEIPIAVPDLAVVDDVDVRIRLDHTFDADLTISLVSPDGSVVLLASGNGGPLDNFGAGAADCSGTATVLDDGASTSIVAGIAPFTGSFRPLRPLAALNGKATQGTWRVRVTDSFFEDQGTVFCAELVIKQRARECCQTPRSTSGRQ